MSGVHGRVIHAIGEAIVSGRLPPGDLLPRESDLVERFGVSRTAVREAVKVLAAKGLLETRQRVGTRIRPREQWNHFDPEIAAWHLSEGFSADFIRDLIELRQINEPAAARLASSRATFEDVALIESAYEAMAASTNDAIAYAEADVNFHMSVFAASHNNLLSSLSFTVRRILEITFKLHQESKAPKGYSVEQDLALHRAVLDEISRGEPDRAAEAMSNVVAAAKRDLIQASRHQGRGTKAPARNQKPIELRRRDNRRSAT
jgi:GntR family galactonate operon transcriptional repressor